MNDPKQYRVLMFFANLISGYGWLIVIVWFLLGVGLGWSFFGPMVSILLGVVLGLFVGVPIIAGGQLLSVWLDQRNYLRDIANTLVQRP